ncbi:MAG: hypothetical protein FWH59_01695 [Lentimicrobiaceae bacterium]|nr:hypothetical protein [Lentimicrobiaceae bacterium]
MMKAGATTRVAPASDKKQTNMKKLTLLRGLFCFLLSAFCFLPLSAQNEKIFEEFQKSINQEFNHFQDSIHTVFAKALEEQWEEFQVFAKIPAPVKPNPKTPPVADTLKTKPVAPVEIPIKENPPQKEEPEPQDNKPELPKIDEETKPEFPKEPSINYINKEIHLWNTTFKIPYNITLENLSLTNTQEKTIADFYLNISHTDYQPAVNAIDEIKNRNTLNDYGVALLCYEYAKLLCRNKPNESVVLSVFLFNQFLIDAKITRLQNRLEPVLHSPQTVYGMSYIENNGKKYYFLFSEIEPSSIYTYKINFSEKITGLDFNVYKPVNISNVLKDKELLVKRLNKTVKIAYSQSAIDYYKDYPQVNVDINANAAVSDVFRNSVNQQFKPLLANKTEYEAVDILLNFMQYGFEYKEDEDQFGREKWNFCEENLYYPYNDCDDRAILFSYLLRELLHLDVVLVLYSDHISTAVRFNTPVTGDYFTMDGEKYVICDPTYIGAIIGMNQPKFKNEEAEIVRTKKL